MSNKNEIMSSTLIINKLIKIHNKLKINDLIKFFKFRLILAISQIK